MKNEPAQNVEIKDFNPAVGTMPLILRRAFGTARWRPVMSLRQFRAMRKMAEAITASARKPRFIRESIAREQRSTPVPPVLVTAGTREPAAIGR